MRKIMSLVVFALVLVLFSGVVAAESMLEISEITVKVDSDRQRADESGGTIKVTPDSTLSLKIKVKNLYSSGTDGGKIENINVRGVIEGIDDESDLDEEANDFDLSPGRDKTITIDYKIPLRLETDGSWKLTLTAEGDDENNTAHSDEVEFDVDADKESYELRFIRDELSPATVACDRQSRLTIRIINTGENDEDDVELTVDAPGLDYHEVTTFDIPEDVYDDENEYEFTDTIIPGDVAAGTYQISIRAVYHGGRKTLEDTINLGYEGCEAEPVQPTTPTQPTTPVEQPVQQPTQPVVQPIEVVTQPTVQPTVSTGYARPTAVVATPKTSYTNNGWLENNWLTVFLIIDVLLIVAGIIVVAAVLKRRR